MMKYKVSIFLVIFLASRFYSRADNIDLAPLLNASGDITLNSSNTYYLTNPYSIQRNTTIAGNGAAISILNGPLYSNGYNLILNDCNLTGSAGWAALAIQNGSVSEIQGGSCQIAGSIAVYVSDATLSLDSAAIRDSGAGINAAGTSHLTINSCSFENCAASYYHNKGTSSWTGGSITQAGGYAVNFLDSVNISMNGTHIAMSDKNSVAIQILKTSTGILNDITIEGCSHGIMTEEGDVTLQYSSLSSPFEYLSGAGVGIVSLKGSHLLVHHVGFTGFENAVQVNSYIPRGGATVHDSYFLNTEVSALSVIGASDVVFKDNYCQDTRQDTVYMQESSGIVERNRIIHSLNTGIAVVQCNEGVLIKDNYIKGCEHQGIAVVNYSDQTDIIQNTLDGNVICNLLVDETSRTDFRGNLCHGNPAFNLRFQGSQGSSVECNLVCDSHSGIEVKDSANPAFFLNRIANIPDVGIINYNSSDISISFCHFYNNGTLSSSNYGIYNNTSSILSGNYNNIGPAGSRGLYNNAGNRITFTQNYWGASNGPRVGESGSGAILAWNTGNGSSVAYLPYISQPPLSSDHAANISLLSGQKTTWTAGFGNVSIDFNAKGDIPTVTDQLCGALQSQVTDPLTSREQFPPDNFPGRLYTIWASSLLCMFSDSITVTLPYDASITDNIQLYRRNESGIYEMVESVQNAGNHTVTYNPDDPFNATGTYTIGKKRSSTPRSFVLY
jgi:hypothetical protein